MINEKGVLKCVYFCFIERIELQPTAEELILKSLQVEGQHNPGPRFPKRKCLLCYFWVQ